MNIALFASAFYPHVGGVEELVRQLAHAYRAKGLGVVVITTRWPSTLPAFEEYEGIPTYRFAMRTPEGNIKARMRYALTHSADIRQMLGVLKTQQIDLLHVQCVSNNGYYAYLAKKVLGLPLVVTTQGERTMDATQIYQRSGFLRQTLRTLLAEADSITACSQDTLDDVENFFGAPFGPRAHVIYNGINLANFHETHPYPHPKPYILGIGRLVPQKGFDVLLHAFARADLPMHDLLLAGEGTERTALERLSITLGLQDQVHFLGRADRSTTVSLFQSCSFFVLPSRREPQGIVNLEAMAAGKAVLASRVGGVAEIVLDDRTGLLVPGDDPQALARGLVRLADNPELCQRLGRAGWERAREFDWQGIADQYLELYRRLGQARYPAAVS